MAEHAGESIPKACASWAQVMGAYRLLSNGDVDPHAVQTPHRQLTRKACANLPVVLAVSDITDLDFTGRTGIRGLGRLGDGGGQGLQQHTTLAVGPEGGVIGVLRQHWYRRPEASGSETRRQMQLLANGAAEVRLLEADLGSTPLPAQTGALLGLALWRFGEFEDALDAWESTSVCEPGDLTLHLLLAWRLAALDPPRTVQVRRHLEAQGLRGRHAPPHRHLHRG